VSDKFQALISDNRYTFRFMPPTLIMANMPRVGIVIARLMVHGEDRGVRPFVVALGDGKQMCKGVTGRYVKASCGFLRLEFTFASTD
jgi:acyl-CoA oxidase